MKENIPQAIALCRVSTKGQLLDGNLEPQEERIIRAGAILNVKIVQ
jgi:DNA invertase Pin-like site-specific DNA recombinase